MRAGLNSLWVVCEEVLYPGAGVFNVRYNILRNHLLLEWVISSEVFAHIGNCMMQ